MFFIYVFDLMMILHETHQLAPEGTTGIVNGTINTIAV